MLLLTRGEAGEGHLPGRRGRGGGRTHLDPTPDGREERGRVDDGDRAERLGVVGGRERGGFLEVRAEVPEEVERDRVEVDDRRAGGDGRRRDRAGEGAAETEHEPREGLVEHHAGFGSTIE